MWNDFHKPQTEAWLTEVFPALQEIDHTINHLPDWMEDKDGSWSFLFPLNHSRSHFEPKGRVLIMAPWNYPFLLFVSPIVAAIAAGNVVTAKPSLKTPQVAAFLESLVAEVFPQNEVAVVLGAGAELGETNFSPSPSTMYSSQAVPKSEPTLQNVRPECTPESRLNSVVNRQ